MKTCTKCGELKTFNSFSPDRRRKSGLQSACKSCSNAANIKRYRENPEVRLRKKIYDVEYVNKNRERKYKNNDRWNQDNIDKVREAQRKRKKLHRHKIAADARKRQAAKKKRTPPWLTPAQVKEMEDFYWLTRDLKSVTGETYHVDHIVPLQGKTVCGLHVPWNLQVLPSDVNERKGNRLE